MARVEGLSVEGQGVAGLGLQAHGALKVARHGGVLDAQRGGGEWSKEAAVNMAAKAYAHVPYPVGTPLTLCRDIGQTAMGVGVAHRTLRR